MLDNCNLIVYNSSRKLIKQCENYMSIIKQLKDGITERGNTALINTESGSTVFFCELEPDTWLESSVTPENYPACNIQIIKCTTANIRTHIEENLCDTWTFLKNGIGANAQDNSPVELDFVMSAVLTKLYNDNKDYKTNDTVTVIHDFLASKDWSLDIADIENLRQEFDEDK